MKQILFACIGAATGFIVCAAILAIYDELRHVLHRRKTAIRRDKVPLIQLTRTFAPDLPTATQNRLEWKGCHPYARFEHEDYQALWMLQIGAEDRYRLSIGDDLNNQSWLAYCDERKNAENEKYS